MILIGDMKVPTTASDDPVYRALKRRAFVRTRYSSEAGTTPQEFTTYDQVVFANDNIAVTNLKGQTAVVVDYDNFVFRDLWQQVEDGIRTRVQFQGVDEDCRLGPPASLRPVTSVSGQLQRSRLAHHVNGRKLASELIQTFYAYPP